MLTLNGYAPEKGIRRHLFLEVNGFAPEKVVSTVILSICSSFLQVDGRQNDAFSCFTGALKHLRKLNGYGADYAQIIIQDEPKISQEETIRGPFH